MLEENNDLHVKFPENNVATNINGPTLSAYVKIIMQIISQMVA